MRATCSAHLVPFHLNKLIIFGETYKSRSASLCNFRQFPVSSNPNCLSQHRCLCSSRSVRPMKTEQAGRTAYTAVQADKESRQAKPQFCADHNTAQDAGAVCSHELHRFLWHTSPLTVNSLFYEHATSCKMRLLASPLLCACLIARTQ